uniref:Claudin n=1 Tax=Callorhinchus milii TaxID=7868 RepID=K4FUH6_CALMI|nr:claudin-10A isoform 2 [Callorhinchus milii]
MAHSGMQILGFMFGVIGNSCVLAATLSKEWKITSRASSVITATWVFQGLWTNCAGNALGSVQCREHLTLFKLDALMGMKCTNVGGSERIKAKATFCVGFMFILAGLSPMVACSWYAYQVTLDYNDPLMPKYELGTALFVGWSGAALCIMSGVSFCLSISEDKHPRRMGYGAAPFLPSRTMVYNGATEVRSAKGVGMEPKQFDKNSYV